MKFNTIVGNPPYMITTGGGGKAKNQAIPIYQYFVDLAISTEPRFISMLMPSKWFAGGMTELTKFRSMMMNDSHLCTLIDYSNSKNCFPDVSIGGGICYFLRDSTYTGLCQVTNIINGNAVIAQRQLNDFAVLVRYNEAVEILHKVCQDDFIPLATIISPLCPFGFTTDARGRTRKSETNNLTLYSSQGKTYVSRQEVKNGLELIDKYKVMLGKMASEHAGEPSKADGKYRVFTNSMKVLQ